MRYQLIIFDMDGTLVEEMLDFDQIRRDIGLPAHGPILEQIATLPAAAQSRAHTILERHEDTAAAQSRLHPGAADLLAQLSALRLQTALLTRNSPACTQLVLARHHLRFDHIATRAHTPYKPHPDSILNIVRALNADLARTLMVGDAIYDLQAAQRANCASAWLKPRHPRADLSAQATYVLTSLADLLPIITTPAP
ncbi:MAG: HAD family hydrolase [Phycisphaerae bacterium]